MWYDFDHTAHPCVLARLAQISYFSMQHSHDIISYWLHFLIYPLQLWAELSWALDLSVVVGSQNFLQSYCSLSGFYLLFSRRESDRPYRTSIILDGAHREIFLHWITAQRSFIAHLWTKQKTAVQNKHKHWEDGIPWDEIMQNSFGEMALHNITWFYSESTWGC